MSLIFLIRLAILANTAPVNPDRAARAWRLAARLSRRHGIDARA